MTERVYRALSRHRQVVALLVYGGVTVAAFLGAFLLRFEFRWPEQYTEVALTTLPLLVAFRLLADRMARMTHERWRHIGIRDLIRLVGATTGGSLLFYGSVVLLGVEPGIPRSVILLEWGLTLNGIAAVWMGYRAVFETLYRRRRTGNGEARRTLIIGAGEAGSRLAREMLRDPAHYRVVGFVDDDPLKWGTTIQGWEVIGGVRDLASIADQHDVQELIIAVPGVDLSDLRRIVESCNETGLPYRVLPSITSVLEGEVRLHHLRKVKIEDLLGREPVQLSLPEIAGDLRGKTVLITGAAGSIGSELTRQVAVNGPKRLILYEQNESELYFVDLELRKSHPGMEIVPVVGDILDHVTLEETLQRYTPQRIFHAAAYKHVPLMETNVRSACRNNVVGTQRVAEAAGAHGCEKFVLISTDKAVRPSNVMGATKRAAELVVTACQARHPDTWYTVVRFGNVLGSRGSVIPLFKRQLESGEPLTVTDPEVTRYFMTIPEAVQLVLQASLLEVARGRVAMLEMGEPVKILELARNLLRLGGYKEGVDARIVFTGLRPGEKLHEELMAPDEEALPTSVEKIRVIRDQGTLERGCPDPLYRRIASADDAGSDEWGELLGSLLPGFSDAATAPEEVAVGDLRTA